jgi:hypothetical protein
MRAALFGQIDANSDAMGAMTETAIFSQWQHSKTTELYYARWKSGEIDIVHLDKINQLPSWIVEVKWSDRPYQSFSELNNCVDFAMKNHQISQPIRITSKTVADSNVVYKGISFSFQPSSLYAYTLGANLLRNIDNKLIRQRLPEDN